MILIVALSLLLCTQVFRLVRWARNQDRRELEVRHLERILRGTHRR